MTGARINIDKLKETLRSKLKGRNPDELIANFQIFDICNDQGKYWLIYTKYCKETRTTR